jgi:CHAT domain-containing protein
MPVVAGDSVWACGSCRRPASLTQEQWQVEDKARRQAAEQRRVERLYVAPDGVLYLLPFGLLRGPNGRTMLETKDVRIIQTGRDLLRPVSDHARHGLVAMGDIDFDHAPAAGGTLTAISSVCTSAQTRQVAYLTRPAAGDAEDTSRLTYARDRAAESLHFGRLPHSGEEVNAIAAQYCFARLGERVEVDTGMAASKARLRALPEPPRVLHLATHGFYHERKEPADRPLLLAGIALAGANATLRDRDRQDGILSALEALDLGLEGTELVVLSACETAQGQINYGDGVSSLARALRTAGAHNVLVTLRPVGDRDAQLFMQRFYGHWLEDARGDVAVALRQTQMQYIEEQRNQSQKKLSPTGAGGPAATVADAADQNSRGGIPFSTPYQFEIDTTWASFILVGGSGP